MSKKETQNTEQKQEKIITNYDRKMQKRKEQKEKEKKQQRINTFIGVAVVAVLVCVVASFPIRTYMAVHRNFVNIGGENITKVEFDYNYNVVKNNYLTQYGSYLSYFGLDASSDLSTQMYSDTLTWQDYFEQMTVDNLVRSKALSAQAKAEGFSYDASQEYADFEESVKNAASEAGVAVKTYVKQIYGPYATLGRISDYVKEAITVSKYYDQVAEQKAPSDEEIQTYYNENKDNYDSVDYRLVTVKAKLPTEPTELADQIETQEPAATDTPADGTAADGSAEEPYQPSEAEIAAAMADAKELADKAVKTVAKDGDLKENMKKAGAAALIRDWLFDSSRKAGDTTVIEDATGNQYYVLAFEKRYLDETPSADVRVLITQDQDGQALLDEWKAGEATEESFGALCAKYSDDTATAANGGLFEAVTKSGMPEILTDWLFDSARAEGDTVSITTEDAYTYVMYYVGANKPEWQLSIKNTLLNDIMTAYVEEISEAITVEDPKGNLNYLKVEADETAESSAETTDGAADTETADTDTAQTGETTPTQAQ